MHFQHIPVSSPRTCHNFTRKFHNFIQLFPKRPLDEMTRFGLTEQDLFTCEVTDKYRAFMKFQIDRARYYYKLGNLKVSQLNPKL